MTSMHFADTETVDDFLAQSGVKGMKWGVRKDRSSGSSSASRRSRPVGSNELKSTARVSAKQVAWTVTKVGLPPLLIATGVGAPIAVSVGVSMRLIGDPVVKQAVNDAGAYLSSVKKDLPKISMESITKSNKIKEFEASARSNEQQTRDIRRAQAQRTDDILARSNADFNRAMEKVNQAESQIAQKTTRLKELDQIEADIKRRRG